VCQTAVGRSTPRITLERPYEASISAAAWLIEEGYDVICFMAAIGWKEDFKAAPQKAPKIDAKEYYIEGLNNEFVKELCFSAILCNVIYERSTCSNAPCQSHHCSSPDSSQREVLVRVHRL
jgi:hypothetical protein